MKENFKTAAVVITAVLIAAFFTGCQQDDEVVAAGSATVSSAKEWFKEYEGKGDNYVYLQNLNYEWSGAIVKQAEDGTETIVVPIKELKINQSEIWQQRLYLYKLPDGSYKASVVEIYPDKAAPQEDQSMEGGNFNGYISIWDLKKGFVKAAQFKNNHAVEDGIVEVLDREDKTTYKALPMPCEDCMSGGGSNTTGTVLGDRLRSVVVIGKSGNSTGNFSSYYYSPRSPVVSSGFTPDSYTSSRGGNGGGGISAPTAVQIIDALTGKAKCIFEKLKNSSTGFEKAIKKFDGEFSVSHLKLSINNNLEKDVYGITIPPVNYITEVQISNNALEGLSDLGKATVFAHEIIHAEIFRKMLSAAQKGIIDPATMSTQQQIDYVNSLKNNFPGLYDYYYKRYKENTWNHEMMANHYRSTIADVIEEFDNKRLSRATYEAVAWVGLGKLGTSKSTIAWDNLTPKQKETINTLIKDNFFNGPSNCE